MILRVLVGNYVECSCTSRNFMGTTRDFVGNYVGTTIDSGSAQLDIYIICKNADKAVHFVYHNNDL